MSLQNAELRSKIYAEKVEYLYSNAGRVFALTLVVGCFFAFLQYSVVPVHFVLIWLSSLIIVATGRVGLAYFYFHQDSAKLTPRHWHFAYSTGSFLAGCMWASTLIFMFPSANLPHQILVFFLLSGVISTAVSVLSSSLNSFYLFVTPIIITVIAQIFFTFTDISLPLCLMVIFYIIGQSLSAHSFHKSLVSSFTLRFNNHDLYKEILVRKQAQDQLHQQQERLQITFSAMTEGVIIVGLDSTIEYINPAAETIFDLPTLGVIGQNINDIVFAIDSNTKLRSHAACLTTLKSNHCEKKTFHIETENEIHKVIEEISTPLQDSNGTMVGAVSIFRDITEASEYNRQLVHLANHDSLTGLPNRALLCDRLEHAITKASRAKTLIAVLFLDLNRFKHINDSLGHSAGDRLLCHVAEHILLSIRQEDTVVRFGGDEFIIILEDIAERQQAEEVATKIINHIAEPITLCKQTLSAQASIGIAIFPTDGRTAPELIKNADSAMYRAKDSIQHHIQFFNADLHLATARKLKLSQQLSQAIEKDQFEIFYQPQLCLDKDKIIGFESLLRWYASPDDLLTPEDFIDVAEDSGSILKIGRWVLQQACRQCHIWHHAGFDGLCVAVNLSPHQLWDDKLVEQIKQILLENDLPPHVLELEISAHVFLSDPDKALRQTQRLKTLGIKLTIDNFDTALSSFSSIDRLSIDKIKIDKSLVHALADDSKNVAITRSIVDLGKTMHLIVVAEGVETSAQRDQLKELGCHCYQGNYFSQAIPAKEATRRLKSHQFSFQQS